MTLLLSGNLDFFIHNNDLGYNNKENGYCRHPKNMLENLVIL